MAWHKFFSREYSVQYAEIAMRAFTSEAREILRQPADSTLLKSEGGTMGCYCLEEEYAAFVGELRPWTWKNLDTLKGFIDLYEREGGAYLAASTLTAFRRWRRSSPRATSSLQT